MIGYGTHYQPPGTFSDDTSLTFCLAEALTYDFDLNVIATNFIKWYRQNYWTARGEVFDIGFTTRDAIGRLIKGERPDLAGGFSISTNGNGSLMRISPLVLYVSNMSVENRYDIVKKVSSITHAHIRSVISCFYYIEFCRLLLLGKDKWESYNALQSSIGTFLHSLGINSEEITLFDRLLVHNINTYDENSIESSGYVIHTLEASIWCLMQTDNFKDAVLKAVNLGDDTDTVGAVTGGLAGLLYGFESIPEHWMNKIARANDIIELSDRLSNRYIEN